jgi:hypothetical protein
MSYFLDVMASLVVDMSGEGDIFGFSDGSVGTGGTHGTGDTGGTGETGETGETG